MFQVDGPSSKLFAIIATIEKQPTGYELREEYLFPGMDDARIIQTVLRTASPVNVQVKTFTASSPSGVYYEAFLGFKNDDLLTAGLYDHEASGEKVLADFNVALNNNRILSVKSNWERKNVRNVFVSTKIHAGNYPLTNCL
jgi:hypothetical protein